MSRHRATWRLIALGVSTTFVLSAAAAAQDRPPAPPPDPIADAGPPAPEPASAKKGLLLDTDAAFDGYTLFAPLQSTTTYLVDMKGQLVHSWPSARQPGQAVYLLEDGRLLRCEREPGNQRFGGGGIGGRVERIAPDGAVEWTFAYTDEHHCQHHDIEPLPNGNILMIAWEKKTRDDALAAGRDPALMTGEELWPDCVIEVRPHGASDGEIVWEWHVWDHVVQEFDKAKPNYGVVAEHPELVDLNYRDVRPRESPAEMRRLRSLGYVGGAEDDDGPKRPEGEDGEAPDDRVPPRRDRGPGFGPGPPGFDRRADWCHTNSIAYNAELDQIVLSVHNFSEIWIIDHSTTTKEAAGHTGGRSGKGGDLLYRWGNPRAYGAGTADDQQLFAQHDARWIPKGSPGAGRLLVFNNGMGRPGEPYSSVIEIAPPVEASGRYRLERGEPFGPDKPSWEYLAENRVEFFASHISGAERLPNGNTLICDGEQGRIFEVTAERRIVWDYQNPYQEQSGPPDGPLGQPGDGRRPPRFDGPDGGGPPGPPPFDGRGGPLGPDGRPGPPGGGRFGPRGRPFGPGGLFRATRLPANHPGVSRVLAEARKQ